MVEILYVDKKRSKYSNEKIVFAGLTFDSKLERDMFCWLKSLGCIKKLSLHHPVAIKVNDLDICKVLIDFRLELASGDVFFADAKANCGVTETPLSRLKFKLVHAITGKKVYLLPKECNILEHLLLAGK